MITIENKLTIHFFNSKEEETFQELLLISSYKSVLNGLRKITDYHWFRKRSGVGMGGCGPVNFQKDIWRVSYNIIDY